MTPMSETTPDFDSADAYAVLDLITSRRTRNGWTPAGRKIGFTNRTIWELYGIERPLWAPVWEQTVRHADANTAALSLARLVQPRIEPEVVFKLRRPVAAVDRPEDLIDAIEWVAPGFEIVHCHFPGWRFALADCTADFGLHGALVVGTPVEVNDSNAATIVANLPGFELTLARRHRGRPRGRRQRARWPVACARAPRRRARRSPRSFAAQRARSSRPERSPTRKRSSPARRGPRTTGRSDSTG